MILVQIPDILLLVEELFIKSLAQKMGQGRVGWS